MRKMDLIGKKFNMLTVVAEAGKCRYGHQWECICDCGNKIITWTNALTAGYKKNCGCKRMFEKYDLTGMRFGRLVVISETDCKENHHGNDRKWICRCNCGNEKIVRGQSLKRGYTTSCGCYAREKASEKGIHHLTNTRIHHCWAAMLCRCGKKKGYTDVSVCEEWKDFMTFYKWAMENGYDETLTIDRIDPFGNYEPSNCRWTDNKTQQNNKRNNRYFTIDGVTHTMKEWSEIYGVDYSLVKGRIYNGKTIQEALNAPRQIRRRYGK